MQGIFQKENTDKALKYGIYRHLPTYEKIIRNLVSFYIKNIENMIKLTNYLERKIVKGNKYEKTSTSLYNWKYDLKWMWSKRRK